MSSEVESDDGFDPAPLPTKRRRLNKSVWNDSTSCDNVSNPGAQAQFTKKSVTQDWTSPKKKTQRPKHLIRVYANENDVEDKFFTQLPNIPSSPWRIRGARWKKSQSNTATLDKSTNKSISTDHGQDSVTLGNKDPTSNNYKPNQHMTRELTDPLESEHNPKTIEIPSLNTSMSEHSANAHQPPAAPPALSYDFTQELADLPSDAFASSSSSPMKPSHEDRNHVVILSSQPGKSPPRRTNLAAPKRGLQQTTLFGQPLPSGDRPSQTSKTHNWPLASRDEPPTHHKLDEEALKTYVYPTNLGGIRDYQFSIVKRGLYHNLLVALPTGLGKTFIAATIMLNWFRWTKDAQIIFVAPSKPLVSQQVEACFKIAGIPRSETTMLTGDVHVDLRKEEYKTKRIFFMTPQTITNDLKRGICDPKRIVLLVVDEAHRSTGAYSYVEVVKFIRGFNQSFRVLALTATPGSSVESVQEVIDGLDISRIEIRTELSIDIRQYNHTKKIEQVAFDSSDEMEMIMDLFSKSLQPVLNRLRNFNAFWSADPMKLTPYGLTRARQQWMGSAGKSANISVKGMVNRMFTVLATLAHSIELLKYHGIGPFYHGMIVFQNNLDSAKGNKYETEIANSEHFRKMMTTLKFWVSNAQFIGHPKLDYLQSAVLKHFSDAGEADEAVNGETTSASKIMIFAQFRDSAEEIVRVLKRNEPIIRPHVFVGQASSKGSEGMDQKRQSEVIKQFKSGKLNTIVATSIGEEGLDIGEVDLILCYDSSASPIRMLQRMGRTGRKRNGKIILLLMKGKEENNFASAKDNYEKIQQMICDAKKFSFHDDRSRRIVPRLIEPVVDKRLVDIPTENKDDSFLPVPKRNGRAAARKKDKKTFDMPDGVRTGFVKASRMEDHDSGSDNEGGSKPPRKRGRPFALEELEAIPSLDEVLLTEEQYAQLSIYQDVPTADDEDLVIAPPSLRSQASRQSQHAPTKTVKHGRVTTNAVWAFQAMREVDDDKISFYKHILETVDTDTLCNDSRLLESDSIAVPIAKGKNVSRRKSPVSKAGQKGGKLRNPTNFNEYDCIEGQSSSPPATDPQLRLPSQGIELGSDTSGDEEEEGEPSSQLRDFIADDDEEDLDVYSEASSLENTPRASEQKSLRTQPFYVSQASTQGGSHDDELPDLDTLLATKSGRGDIETTEESGALNEPSPADRKRKRRVIEDSSD